MSIQSIINFQFLMFLEKDSPGHLFWIIEKNKVKYPITYFDDFIKPVVYRLFLLPASFLITPEVEAANRG